MPGLMNKVAAALSGLHGRIYTATGGKVAGAMKGVDMVVLETTGRTSGQRRARPLMKIEHDGEVHVIASNNGSDVHPAWFLNVQANPTVRVQDGPDNYAATAVVLEGDDRDAVYASAKEQMDNFVGYEQKSSRTIPVVRLERA